MKKSIPTIRERKGNEKKTIPLFREREGNDKKAFPKSGNGKGMKKSITIIRERESEAFILGNGWEREFPLTPASNKSYNHKSKKYNSLTVPSLGHVLPVGRTVKCFSLFA